MSFHMLSSNKSAPADENADVVPVTRKRFNQDSLDGGSSVDGNAKKSLIQPFSSVNNKHSSADSEKQDDSQEFIPFNEKTPVARLEERIGRLERMVMNLTEMVEEMNTNMTESQISVSQLVDEVMEERAKVSQLDKAAKEMFALNDQLAQENEQYKQEVINLQNILKEYEILRQCLKQEQ